MRAPEVIRHLMLVEPYFTYSSDAINKPETFPGAQPESGFILKTKKDFPPGEHILYMTYVLSTEPYKVGSGAKINQQLSEPFPIKTRLMPRP